jgi:hypothetical protein
MRPRYVVLMPTGAGQNTEKERNMQIVTPCGSKRARRARGALAVASVTLVGLGSLAFPYAASATPVPASSTGSSTCDKVSASQVSAVVGYSLPNPTADVEKNQVLDKKQGLKGSSVGCTYMPKGSSMKAVYESVELSYIACNKSVNVSEAEADFKSQIKGEKGKWAFQQDNLAHSAIFFSDIYKISGQSEEFEGVIEIDGSKMIGAIVVQKQPESTVNKLAGLAASAWF